MRKKKPLIKALVSAKSENNFSENSGLVSASSLPVKKKGAFPYMSNKGKPNKIKILQSHREVFKMYKENGFKSLGKAIRQSSVYSPSVADHPKIITQTISWQALLDEQMPEQHLALRHKEILDKRDRRMVPILDDFGNPNFYPDGKPMMREIDDGPNTAAVTKGLDMAYRLRGSFKEQEQPKQSTVMYNLFYKPEIREQMKVFEDGISKSLYESVARQNQKDIEDEEEHQRNIENSIEAEIVVEPTD